MTNYAPLTAIWGAISGSTDTAKLATLNAMTVAGPPQDVPLGSVIGYLGLAGKLKPLIAYASAPPSGAVPASVAVAEALVTLLQMPNAPGFSMSNPTTYAAVNGMLTQLVADPLSGIAAADPAALLALSATTVPWWQANGFNGPLNQNDLNAAGLS